VNERGAPFHPQSMRCWGGTRLEAYFLRRLRRDGRSAMVLVLTFGSGIVGLYLQKRLPTHHMSGGSKDMILAVIGLVTLLLALVLGTLVGNTYASFAMQKSELETMASRALLVDQALAQYGSEAKPARDKLKEALGQSYDLFWRGADSDPSKLKVDVALNRWGGVSNVLNSLVIVVIIGVVVIAAVIVNFLNVGLEALLSDGRRR
jgi:heme A synthase